MNERKKNWARGVRGERKSRVVDKAGKDCLAVAGLRLRVRVLWNLFYFTCSKFRPPFPASLPPFLSVH